MSIEYSALVRADDTWSRLVNSLAPPPIQPPHSANRHDAGCGGAGVDRRRVKMASGLNDHAWTVKEILEQAGTAYS